MALDLYQASRVLHRAQAELRYAQRELYLARTAPKPGQNWLKRKERCVLDALTGVFRMQQCVRRLMREEYQRMDHWRAFI